MNLKLPFRLYLLNQYKKILPDGKRLGIKISFKEQNYPKGLPDAFILGEKFIDNKNVALILGDNFFYGQNLTSKLIECTKLKSGAKIIALEFLDRALTMDLPFSKERRVEVYKLRGEIRFGMDDISQSINDFPYAIEIDAQNAELYYWRGMLYYISNQLDESLEDFKVGIDFEPFRDLTETLISNLKQKIKNQLL